MLPAVRLEGFYSAGGIAHQDCGVARNLANADCAVVPYILRLELLKLAGMWDRQAAIGDWWGRMRERPSVKAAILDRMTETDWAPFRNLAPDPWPKVETLLRAA